MIDLALLCIAVLAVFAASFLGGVVYSRVVDYIIPMGESR